MTDRPILFSGDMVRAILDGRKTQTRRVIKPYSPNPQDGAKPAPSDLVMTPDGFTYRSKCPYGKPGDRKWQPEKPPETGWYYIRGLLDESIGGDNRAVWYNAEHELWGFSPDDDPESVYVDGHDWTGWKRPGDRLWVREAWLPCYPYTGAVPSNAGPDYSKTPLFYRADYGADNPHHFDREGNKIDRPIRWRPSIHMPRWASRITLEVVSVRVERLHDISDSDVRAEGVDETAIDKWRKWLHPNDCPGKAFSELWDGINAKRGHGWASNPWVWVVEFEVANDD